MSSLTSSYCSTTSSMSTTDDMDDFDFDDDSICSSMFSVCSSSAGSLSYSNTDRTRSASVCSTVTAESVARSLIRQISHNNNWPVDVNVQWLISENEAPQQVRHVVITHHILLLHVYVHFMLITININYSFISFKVCRTNKTQILMSKT